VHERRRGKGGALSATVPASGRATPRPVRASIRIRRFPLRSSGTDGARARAGREPGGLLEVTLVRKGAPGTLVERTPFPYVVVFTARVTPCMKEYNVQL
jgi:hypothetical protein